MSSTPITVRRLDTSDVPVVRCRPTVIIADRGDRAWLLLTDGHLPLGARFIHHGLMWEVVGRRELSRALVAEPVHRRRAIS